MAFSFINPGRILQFLSVSFSHCHMGFRLNRTVWKDSFTSRKRVNSSRGFWTGMLKDVCCFQNATIPHHIKWGKAYNIGYSEICKVTLQKLKEGIHKHDEKQIIEVIENSKSLKQARQKQHLGKGQLISIMEEDGTHIHDED